jgi:hypothetical protein
MRNNVTAALIFSTATLLLYVPGCFHPLLRSDLRVVLIQSDMLISGAIVSTIFLNTQ